MTANCGRRPVGATQGRPLSPPYPATGHRMICAAISGIGPTRGFSHFPVCCNFGSCTPGIRSGVSEGLPHKHASNVCGSAACRHCITSPGIPSVFEVHMIPSAHPFCWRVLLRSLLEAGIRSHTGGAISSVPRSGAAASSCSGTPGAPRRMRRMIRYGFCAARYSGTAIRSAPQIPPGSGSFWIRAVRRSTGRRQVPARAAARPSKWCRFVSVPAVG